MDKALARLLPDASRSTIQRWIAEGRVTLRGAPCRARDLVAPGDRVCVRPGAPLPTRAEPDASIEVRALYEDAHLIVLDKPAGLVVHPARGHATGTLVNALVARPGFARAPTDPRDPAGALRPGIVHRIDKETSGLLVVAKDEVTREGLKAQLGAHTVERAYRALTVGVPEPGIVNTVYARDPRSRLRFTSKSRVGRPAVTHVALVERLAGGRAALVECRLETGRTHQIRVHLAEQRRAPILADKLYGAAPRAPELAAIAAELGRQALHAYVLGFVHPVTGAELRFESPWPAELARALERLRAL